MKRETRLLELDPDHFQLFQTVLAQAAPPIKERVVAAAIAVIAADGAVRLPEIELLRAVCAALDCPMPPVNLSA